MKLNNKIFIVNKYYFSYFMIKIFYMFFAFLVYGKITRLGDTSGYINHSIDFSMIIFYKSTYMMNFVGGICGKIFGYTVLSNLPFVILSFYGIYYSLKRLDLSNRDLFFVLLLLSFPSFGVWTSIVSKEAVGVFFMGIILGYIIDLYNGDKRKVKFIEYIAFYLMFVFKPQYAVAIFSIIITIKLFRNINLRANAKLIYLMFYILMVIIGFYMVRDIVNELSYIIPKNFSLDAGSTRENTIWVNDYDLYRNMLYGMFVAWWGPTISEVLSKPIQGIAFIESFIIFSFFIYFLLYILKNIIRTARLNIYLFSIGLFALFWLLFVHYPFGIFNPGSAIRYRENFYGFFVMFFYFIYLQIKYNIRSKSMEFKT